MWQRVKSALIVGTVWLLPLPAAGAALKAGVARVDITPPIGLSMYGYGSRKATSTGILDPLMARVLVLQAGEKGLALVVLDLGEVFAPEWIERLRANAQKSWGMSYVLVAATHTHSGPDIADHYPPREGPDWETGVLEKVSRAIAEAQQREVVARLGTGYGVAYIGHNRLRVNPDGTVTWFEINKTMIPTAPIDPVVSVLRVDTAEGQPLAILVNYACHPVVFGPDNLQYSADWPGVMIRTVEQDFTTSQGAPPLCMFLQGGDGDINPFYAVTPLAEDAVKMRDWTGERVGREAARVAKGIQTEAAPEARLDFVEDLMPFHLRWNPEKFRQAVLASWGPKAAESFDRRKRAVYQLPVATVLIDNRIAWMTLPGEPFVNFQIDWRNRCPVRDAFFLGYANGSFGYFPTLYAASLGGYGAANTATWIEPGAPEQMVDHAVARVYEMLGQLTDVPEDLKK
jgi:neutral/alkaline ceramidase-like enzyme